MNLARDYFILTKTLSELERRRQTVLKSLYSAYVSAKKTKLSLVGKFKTSAVPFSCELLRLPDGSCIAVQKKYLAPKDLNADEFSSAFESYLVEQQAFRPLLFMINTGLSSFIFEDSTEFYSKKTVAVSNSDSSSYDLVREDVTEKLANLSQKTTPLGTVYIWQKLIDDLSWELGDLSINEVAVDPEFQLFFSDLEEQQTLRQIHQLSKFFIRKIEMPKDLVLERHIDFSRTIQTALDDDFEIPKNFNPGIALEILGVGTEIEVEETVQDLANEEAKSQELSSECCQLFLERLSAPDRKLRNAMS